MITQNPSSSHTESKSTDAGASLGKDAENIDISQKPGKNERFALLDYARYLLASNDIQNTKDGLHRTRFCHAVRHGGAEHISLNLHGTPDKSHATLGGMQTCDSNWSCPVCQHRNAMRAAQEIKAANLWAERNGYIPLMLTLTARHHVGMSLQGFKESKKAAWLSMQQTYIWKKTRKELGLTRTIKAVEITHGLKNGWHYHYHVLLYVKKSTLAAMDDAALSGWKAKLTEWWLKCLQSEGLDGLPDYALDIQTHGNVTENYLAKLGLTEDDSTNADYELTGGANKTGKGRTIWAILAGARDGDAQDAALYLEYVQAMQGDAWIVWSKHFKSEIDLDTLLEEIAAMDDDAPDTEEDWMILTDDDYKPVRRLYATADLLRVAARYRSRDRVRLFLDTLRCRMDEEFEAKVQELQRALLMANRRTRACQKAVNRDPANGFSRARLNDARQEYERIKQALRNMGELV